MKKINILRLLIILIIILIIGLYINKFEYFTDNQDAYIINLDKRTDRWETIQNSFKNTNINLKRFSGLHMTDELKKEKYSNVPISKGQLGFSLSHMLVLEMAKKNNMNTILILEDDCKPTNSFDSWFIVKKWLDANLDKWDIYNGGTCYYNYQPDKKDKLKSVCHIDNNIKLYYCSQMCTQFIYVNSKSFDKLLDWKKSDMSIVYDNWPEEINLQIITSIPFITNQEISYSDLSETNSDSIDTFKKSEEVISKVENTLPCY
jgi:hypothetical protein